MSSFGDGNHEQKTVDMPNFMNLSLEQEKQVADACSQAATHWGVKSQLVALLEEMAELQVLVAKRVNDKQNRVENFDAKVIDEMADVYFLLSQLEMIFNNSDAVKERLLYKCERTVQFIQTGQKSQ
jgi:hypothetical protein